MNLLKVVSNVSCTCSLLSFGNTSWSWTPFGLSADNFVPIKNRKQIKTGKKQEVSFEIDDNSKIF